MCELLRRVGEARGGLHAPPIAAALALGLRTQTDGERAGEFAGLRLGFVRLSLSPSSASPAPLDRSLSFPAFSRPAAERSARSSASQCFRLSPHALPPLSPEEEAAPNEEAACAIASVTTLPRSRSINRLAWSFRSSSSSKGLVASTLAAAVTLLARLLATVLATFRVACQRPGRSLVACEARLSERSSSRTSSLSASSSAPSADEEEAYGSRSPSMLVSVPGATRSAASSSLFASSRVRSTARLTGGGPSAGATASAGEVGLAEGAAGNARSCPMSPSRLELVVATERGAAPARLEGATTARLVRPAPSLVADVTHARNSARSALRSSRGAAVAFCADETVASPSSGATRARNDLV